LLARRIEGCTTIKDIIDEIKDEAEEMRESGQLVGVGAEGLTLATRRLSPLDVSAMVHWSGFVATLVAHDRILQRGDGDVLSIQSVVQQLQPPEEVARWFLQSSAAT